MQWHGITVRSRPSFYDAGMVGERTALAPICPSSGKPTGLSRTFPPARGFVSFRRSALATVGFGRLRILGEQMGELRKGASYSPSVGTSLRHVTGCGRPTPSQPMSLQRGGLSPYVLQHGQRSVNVSSRHQSGELSIGLRGSHKRASLCHPTSFPSLPQRASYALVSTYRIFCW